MMFQITVAQNATEVTYTFDQPRVVIGSKEGSPVDLTLKGPSILPIHAAIFFKENDYIVENLAHDPELRVNGSPFWRKKLKTGDEILLGKCHLYFSSSTSTKKEPTHHIKEILIIEEEEEEALPQTDKAEAPSNPYIEKKNPYHLKEIGTYLVELLKTEKQDSGRHVIFLFLGFSTLLFSLFAITFYVSVIDTSEKQRMIAARGLSDIAITLSYAKMHQLTPPDQNWLDPTFLKETSKHVIPESLTKRSWIDKGGAFQETPYLLRIYSDPDFDRFLLIAQPKANFVQWLIPNNTIIVDSKRMVMKEAPDLKDLNRLLVNTSGFAGLNQQEIVALVEGLNSLRLSSLAKDREGLGFMPPKELTLVNNDLELYLYNAPRYYLWNQTLIEKAHELNSNPANMQEKELMTKSLAKREPFKDMVLYTSKGIEKAIDARSHISENYTECPFHIGYVTLTANGKIDACHILMKNQKNWSGKKQENSLVDAKGWPHLPKDIAELAKNPLNPFKGDSFAKSKKEPFHPLSLELTTILEERELHLKPFLEPLITLLSEHGKQNDRLFFIRYHKLFNDFERVVRDEQNALEKKVNALYEKYVTQLQLVNLAEFFSFLDQKMIDMGYENDSLAKIASLTSDQLSALFALIEKTANIHVLDQAVAEAHEMISNDGLSSLESINSWKNQLRSVVLHKLETMLWDTSSSQERLEDDQERRWIVGRILRNSYITQKEAKEFYLTHFLK